MSDLGFCAPCASSITPSPLMGMNADAGMGDWKSELWDHLKPMAPWLIATALICGYAGWKAGNMYCSSVFLKREASLRKRGRKRRRKKKR